MSMIPTEQQQIASLEEEVRQLRDELAGREAKPNGERRDVLHADAVLDAAHLAHQREFSLRTFGPGARTRGVTDHIRKELVEIEAVPDDLNEWVDVIILAFDGALRAGFDPQEVIDAIKAKQAHNETRVWPDWRTMPTDRAIEHVRTDDAHA